MHRRCRSRCVGAVCAASLGTAFARGGTTTAAAGWRAAPREPITHSHRFDFYAIVHEFGIFQMNPNISVIDGSALSFFDALRRFFLDDVAVQRNFSSDCDTESYVLTKIEKPPLPVSAWVLRESRWNGFVADIRPIIKRGLDIVGALLGLAIAAPSMVLIAFVIALDGGPVFYSDVRIGRNKRLFKCHKFRTMVVDADHRLAELLQLNSGARQEWEQTFKLRRDPRITPIGRLLRKTSLDELPQLFNVLTGTMSLVGPRPVWEAQLFQHYGPHAPDYLVVRPGLTGPWQVSGRSDTGPGQRVALDVGYVRNQSIRTDLLILCKTVPAVLSCRGAR
jgi:exopolysaccharide production protein ExoY